MSLAAAAASLVAAGSVVAAAPPAKVTLTAPTHKPKVNTHWNYSVTVTSGGKPAAAKLTVAIVDPLGTAHPVQFGKSTKYVTNWPFKGSFRDFVIWPSDSAVGLPLVFRVTVVAGPTKKVIGYTVTPKP
jgi:hypothetical protein